MYLTLKNVVYLYRKLNVVCYAKTDRAKNKLSEKTKILQTKTKY